MQFHQVLGIGKWHVAPLEVLNRVFVLWQATIWTVVIYFMTGLTVKDGSWHFWVFYVIMCLTALTGSSLVRFLAYFAPDRDAANALIGIYNYSTCSTLFQL